MLLNFFEDILDTIYYSTRRPISTGSSFSIALVVTLVAFGLSILCFTKVIKKKDDKKPIRWGWVILSLLFLAICVAYSFMAAQSF